MKNNKKVLAMSTLLMAIVLLSVGTIAYFRRAVNGNITGNTGILVFNVNGLTGETNETLEYSLNRSLEEPYVYPDDSGYFDLEITAEGSSTDVYVTLDIIRDHLPENLKFYTGEDHKVVINKKYFFFEKTEEMSETLRIYWFWDGSKDDVNDSLFINEELSARISLNAVPMEYGMMKNGAINFTEIWQDKYRQMIREMTFTNDFSIMPEECTEENLCFNISYEENQKYPVYAYLVETDIAGKVEEDGTVLFEGNLYNLYIISSKTVFAPENSENLFAKFTNLESINFNNWFGTSKVTDMAGMFAINHKLQSLDVSFFDTSGVTNMIMMFAQNIILTELDLSSFDTSNVTLMTAMFMECTALEKINLCSFDTSNVTDMSMLFGGTAVNSLDLSSFDTSNVTDMTMMFFVCENLVELDISNFNTSNVKSMTYMFAGNSNLERLNLGTFDTSSITVTNELANCFYQMFNGCSKLTTEITISVNLTDSDHYYRMFYNVATAPNSKVVVNYTEAASSVIDNIIATKSANSNVIKGSLVS